MKKKETTFQYTPWKKILRQLREEAGLTQQKLALKSTMPQRTIAEYENCGSTRELSIYSTGQSRGTIQSGPRKGLPVFPNVAQSRFSDAWTVWLAGSERQEPARFREDNWH